GALDVVQVLLNDLAFRQCSPDLTHLSQYSRNVLPSNESVCGTTAPVAIVEFTDSLQDPQHLAQLMALQINASGLGQRRNISLRVRCPTCIHSINRTLQKSFGGRVMTQPHLQARLCLQTLGT